ncbi:hypothetical protein GE09DRAFT_1279062 [Coniochaeta sp. 2T2.1]|nr:hypothetical protein GE09DRAFT_1279062 [Coniochaeta sp. 2T2.1]
MPTFAPDCPGADNKFYEAANGKWFLLQCSHDHFGDDLEVLYGLSYTDCCEACAKWPNCDGLAWAPTQEGLLCYLKTDVTGGWIPSPNIWGAIAIIPPPGFPSDFEKQITSTMTALPPEASLQTLTGGFTENTVITTTAPGGHSPTVVPVIYPRGGPPAIRSSAHILTRQRPLNGDTSFTFVTFKDEPQTLALRGLQGCTAVVAISQKGPWIGHFWESPSFTGVERKGDWPRFKRDALDALEVGLPDDVPRVQYQNQYALGELRNQDDKGELGHLVDAENDPRLFLIYPRERAGKGTQEFPELNKKVAEKLEEMFPNFDNKKFKSISCSPITSGDNGDEAYNYPRGKLLIQYMPAPKPCLNGKQGKAQWRFFVENAKTYKANWTPSDDQIFTPRAEQAGRLECPLSSVTGSSASQSPTSSASTSAPSSSPSTSSPSPTSSSKTSSTSSKSTTSSSSTKITSSSSTTPPPPPPSTSSSKPPPQPSTTTAQPAPTTTCTFDAWQYFSSTTNSLTSYLKWSLGKADAGKATWSGDHLDLTWDRDVAVPVAADARLAARLAVRAASQPQPELDFRFGPDVKWSLDDTDAAKMPHVVVVPRSDGRCAEYEGTRYCDRRVISTFLC